MKKNLLLSLLFCLCMLGVHCQQLDRQNMPASLPKGRQLSETEIYHRIRRVAYERRLQIDSATAMRLVLADQAEQQGIQSALEDRSLTVEGRASAISGYRSVRERVTGSVLNRSQQARLTPSSKSSGKALQVSVQKDARSNALEKIMSRYSEGVSAANKNVRLDRSSRRDKIADLERERDRGLQQLDSLHLQGIRELNEQQMKYWVRPTVAPDSTQRRVKELLERSRKAVPAQGSRP